jgi:hypothetical protein
MSKLTKGFKKMNKEELEKELNTALSYMLKAEESIKKFLNSNQKISVKDRFNFLLKEGHFGNKYSNSTMRFIKLPWLKEPYYVCKNMKIILYISMSKDKRSLCRAMRYKLIKIKDRYDIDSLNKYLNESMMI